MFKPSQICAMVTIPVFLLPPFMTFFKVEGAIPAIRASSFILIFLLAQSSCILFTVASCTCNKLTPMQNILYILFSSFYKNNMREVVHIWSFCRFFAIFFIFIPLAPLHFHTIMHRKRTFKCLCHLKVLFLPFTLLPFSHLLSFHTSPENQPLARLPHLLYFPHQIQAPV